MITILRTVAEARAWVAEQRKAGLRVGFVPTMGALHPGHLSLMARAAAICDRTVISIFVNPLQFAPGEDYERYPRTWDRDVELAAGAGAHAVFSPSASEMYSGAQEIFIDPGRLAEPLCGAFRPGHFRGVATVVAKLFNVVQAEKAFFGQKDAQQVVIIQNMVSQLNIPTQIVVCPIVREPDGLAMSSRNAYLSIEDRTKAPILFRALQQAQAEFHAGKRDVSQLEAHIRAVIESVDGVKIDYARVVDLSTLKDIDCVDRPALAAVAVRFGGTRLIDNAILDPEQ
jgi:pantoate--beta-alanine ligase